MWIRRAYGIIGSAGAVLIVCNAVFSQVMVLLCVGSDWVPASMLARATSLPALWGTAGVVDLSRQTQTACTTQVTAAHSMSLMPAMTPAYTATGVCQGCPVPKKARPLQGQPHMLYGWSGCLCRVCKLNQLGSAGWAR